MPLYLLCMNTINSTYLRVFVLYFTLLSLIISSVVFSVGNRKNLKEIIISDSIISGFFTVTGMSDEIINDMMSSETAAARKDKNKDDASQINKEISIALPGSSAAYLEKEYSEIQNAKNVKAFNESMITEVQYPLKIPYNRYLLCLIILSGLIFAGLARSVPVLLNIKFRELVPGCKGTGSFYLRVHI